MATRQACKTRCSIGIYSYAIVSNHYRFVLRINKVEIDQICGFQIIDIIRKKYKLLDVIERYINGEKLSKEYHLKTSISLT
ncbi:MAG: hypothetical protein V7784_01245 [Oceanospirillaceae bacterium]